MPRFFGWQRDVWARKYIPRILASTSRAVRHVNTRWKASQELNIKEPDATSGYEAAKRSMGD